MKKTICPGCGKDITDKLVEYKILVKGKQVGIVFACPHCNYFIKELGI